MVGKKRAYHQANPSPKVMTKPSPKLSHREVANNRQSMMPSKK
jgi:hypothetical protein